MSLRKPYSEKQQEYIDSVDGNAHMSAVGIIGELEARDKEHLAKVERMEKENETLQHNSNIIYGEYKTLKQFIEDAPRYSAIKTTDVPVLFIGDKVPYKLDGGYGDGILEITKVALLEVEK